MIPLIPGYVRALSPFRVECAGDPAGGLPCQRVAPGVVGQRGAVIVAGGQRVWLGAYDKDDLDLTALTDRVTALERVARGSVTVAVSASAGGTATVTFPAGRFTAADQLAIQLTKVGSGLAKYIPYATGVSATGMTVGLYSGDGSATTASVVVHWAVTAY